MSTIIFTRYLYIKDIVELSLLVSILYRHSDAIFWAYELYYSGFKKELFEFIWKIYYDFFATLNPSFEAYLLTKYDEFLNNDCLVSSIIFDLIYRPYNTDIFFMRIICNSFEVDVTYYNNINITNIEDARLNFKNWIETNDYRSIGQWIINLNQNIIDVIDVYKLCLDIFELTKPKLIKDFTAILKTNNIDKNIILLSRIMQLFSKKHNLKKGKSVYVTVEPEQVEKYKTIYVSDTLKHYRILEKACKCSIDSLKHLSLFKLNINKYNYNKNDLKTNSLSDFSKHLFSNWEYYASFSPLWNQRINYFNGIIDHNIKRVIFEDDDLMEEFYRSYGYEPDEQSKTVQDKSIMTIEKVHNWKWFHDKYKNNGLFEVWEEELEEFDIDLIKY
jgi:hypothetical protein